ncbi:uncharacterized protein LOC103517727 [Diaphorina citri]|uniref:Uncharacterized protein LOC103517727 n=1 Tax=Diaphorina citri TaxID=121845 RepID=A0A1S4ELJ8_DIACI|nr:uncharacterized protein LOC103517727 [Diaphorina citri]
MNDHDVDDVAFLTGVNHYQSQNGIHKRSLYEHNGVAVCSQNRALIIASVVLSILFLSSLIIAYVGPQNDCPCIGEKPVFLQDEDLNGAKRPVIPIATSGEVFPWNNVRLPTSTGMPRPKTSGVSSANIPTILSTSSHKYGNAETKDFWSVLSKHSNHSINVKAIMDTWSRQMGFPVIRISRITPQHSSNSSTTPAPPPMIEYSATQTRFLLTNEPYGRNDSKLLLPRSPYDYKWYVPLSYYTDQTGYKEQEIVWMNMTDAHKSKYL